MTLEIVAIVLSLTSLLVTTLGFFASVRFYKDGMGLQGRASAALTRIEQKTALLEDRFGGVLDRTLDAVFKQLPGEVHQDLRLGRVGPPTQEGAGGEAGGPAPREQLAADALRYYMLEGFRVTDVSSGIPRGLFSLGSPHGFNLLDGREGYVFAGFFPELDGREAAARTVLLLRSLGQVREGLSALDQQLQEQAEAVLDQLRVDLFVGEEEDEEEVAQTVERVRGEIPESPPTRVVRVIQLQRMIAEKLEEIGV